MLELNWHSKEIVDNLNKYKRKNKLNLKDERELFLIFAMKKKLKLMSHLINSEDYHIDMSDSKFFIDVLENEVYDMAVLLYREYFLVITKEQDKIVSLLVNSFSKANGMLEAKAFLLKRFITHMRFEQAQTFLEAVEARIYDKSRGNIFVNSLNVVKSACLLIELLYMVKNAFGFMQRRV